MGFTVLGLELQFRLFRSGCVPFGFWSSVFLGYTIHGFHPGSGMQKVLSVSMAKEAEPLNSHKPEVLNPKLEGVLKVSEGASGFWNVTFRV